MRSRRMINPDDAEAVSARYQASIPHGALRDAPTRSPIWCCSCAPTSRAGVTGAQYVVDGGRTATGGAATTVGAAKR